MTSAILSSNPCRSESENGMLSGSPQTRSAWMVRQASTIGSALSETSFVVVSAWACRRGGKEETVTPATSTTMETDDHRMMTFWKSPGNETKDSGANLVPDQRLRHQICTMCCYFAGALSRANTVSTPP